jgi:GNAT superfamily N-acetyltransferase
MTFVARDATTSDYTVFRRLFPELGVHDPPPSAEQFERMRAHVVLLWDDGDPVAYTFWQSYGRTAHVVHVVVDPRARGRGAGRALMDAVRLRAIEKGCARWYLNVKRENAAAIRLYERCGLRFELDAWAMRMEWAQVDGLERVSGAVVFTPEAGEDAELGARFNLYPERIAALRARPGLVLIALREEGAPAGFAAFDPAFPGAYPFRVARPELARPLLDAIRPHARMDQFDFVRLTVEGDRPLADALKAAGAEVSFELVQMSAPLQA